MAQFPPTSAKGSFSSDKQPRSIAFAPSGSWWALNRHCVNTSSTLWGDTDRGQDIAINLLSIPLPWHHTAITVVQHCHYHGDISLSYNSRGVKWLAASPIKITRDVPKWLVWGIKDLEKVQKKKQGGGRGETYVVSR